MSSEHDGLGPDPTPPTAPQVAKRALALSAVTCRNAVELDSPDPAAELLRLRVIKWLKSQRLYRCLDPWERSLLGSKVGTSTQQDLYTSGWRAEGLAILVWALGHRDLPRHNQQVNALKLAHDVGFLCDDAAEFANAASLRPQKEIEAYREVLYRLHWLLRAYLRDGQSRRAADSFEQSWFKLLRVAPADFFTSTELVKIDGRPIHRVPLKRVQECEWIICERHRAAIWLVGENLNYSERFNYSDLPVDT